MTVSCPDCRSVFRVDPAKVPATGVRARCSVCGGVISISGGTLPVAVTPASLGAVTAAAGPRAGLATPQRPYTPAGAIPAQPAPPPPSTMTPPAPAHVSAAPERRTAPVMASGSAPSVSETRAPAAPTAPVAASPLAFAGAAAGTAAASPASAISVAPTPVATTATATPRRSINPFLNADPGQRARRLARALVSDLVAYHPAKRDEGLRDGTLRQLFREDIKKSYEEYVEQVGRDVAEGSPHFQEALNEILGGGRKLF